MERCSFSNPKGDLCECSGNNMKLSECQRHTSRHVQATHEILQDRATISYVENFHEGQTRKQQSLPVCALL